MSTSSTPRPATVRLVRGSADEDELAAVVAVLHALAARRAFAAPRQADVRPRATWRHPARSPQPATWRSAPMSLR
ncbi:acyl-CoA carboxylase epsilon subunit [Streptomyces sp. NPDC101151]|uniref:acyl-CoA carboxylase epsilon subunit n=1 Tax=Streptomyces sp. NPDC101151 TaxID=3366115 RepID=UPI0037FFD022